MIEWPRDMVCVFVYGHDAISYAEKVVGVKRLSSCKASCWVESAFESSWNEAPTNEPNQPFKTLVYRAGICCIKML